LLSVRDESIFDFSEREYLTIGTRCWRISAICDQGFLGAATYPGTLIE
jgi:hypothetical protein